MVMRRRIRIVEHPVRVDDHLMYQLLLNEQAERVVNSGLRSFTRAGIDEREDAIGGKVLPAGIKGVCNFHPLTRRRDVMIPKNLRDVFAGVRHRFHREDSSAGAFGCLTGSVIFALRKHATPDRTARRPAFHSGCRAARRKALANRAVIDHNPTPMNLSSIRTRAARCFGFNLIELMVALSIMAILVAVAAPSFREALMNVRISAQTNDLMADLALARSEAVKRNLSVYLCTSKDQATCNGDSWSQGWIVAVDANADNLWDSTEVAIKARPPAEGNNTIASAGHSVSGTALMIPYRASGTAGNVVRRFVICDSRTTGTTGRRININVTGRPQVERVTCPAAP